MKTCLILLTIFFLINAPALFGQSIYTNQDAIGLGLSAGYLSTSVDVSGSSAGIVLSLKRNVDFSLAVSGLTENSSNLHASYSMIAGGIAFFPMKEWSNDPFTLQMNVSGSKSYREGTSGPTVSLGSSVVKELPLSGTASFYPAVSLAYVPFADGRGAGNTFLGFEGSLAFKIAKKSKIVVNPAITTGLDSKNTTVGIFGGIVL